MLGDFQRGSGMGKQFLFVTRKKKYKILILLHSERPKLYTILAFLSAVGLNFMDM